MASARVRFPVSGSTSAVAALRSLAAICFCSSAENGVGSVEQPDSRPASSTLQAPARRMPRTVRALFKLFMDFPWEQKMDGTGGNAIENRSSRKRADAGRQRFRARRGKRLEPDQHMLIGYRRSAFSRFGVNFC